MRKYIHVLLTFYIISVASALAKDSSDSVVTMPPMDVKDKKASPWYPQDITGATLTDTPVIELPQSVEIMSGKLIKEQDATTFYESMQYMSGVFTGGDSPATRTAGQPNMRGYSGSEVMMNGFSLPKKMPIYLDADAIDFVEYFKGPMFSIYGGETSSLGPYGGGGSINIVTKVAQPESITAASVVADQGDGQSWRVTGDGNRPFAFLDGAARVNVAAQTERPWYVSSDIACGNILFVAPSVVLNPAKNVKVYLDATYQYQDTPSYQGVPYVAGRFSVSPDTYFGDNDTRDNYHGMTVQGRADWKINDSLTARAGVGYSRVKLDCTAWSPSANSGRSAADAIKYYDQLYATARGTLDYSDSSSTDDNIGAYAHLVDLFTLGATENALVFGGDVQQMESESSSSSGKSKSMDLNYPDLQVPSKLSSRDSSSKIDRWGLLLQEQMSWENWRLLAGTRFDRHKSDEGNEGDSWSPRLGLTYLFTPGWAVYGNFTRSESPNFGFDDEDGNELTDSWEANQYEAGSKVNVFADMWGAASVFKIEQANVPELLPGSTTAYESGGENESRGVELSLNGNFTDGWYCWVSYTWQEYEDKEADMQFDRLPKNSLGVWQSYTFQEGPLEDLTAALGYRYRDSQAQTFRGEYLGDKYRVEGYHLFDARLAYQLPSTRGLEQPTISFSVRNIFNTEYVESIRHNQAFPGEPRTFSVSLSANF